jgi:hypothetical protein
LFCYFDDAVTPLENRAAFGRGTPLWSDIVRALPRRFEADIRPFRRLVEAREAANGSDFAPAAPCLGIGSHSCFGEFSLELRRIAGGAG